MACWEGSGGGLVVKRFWVLLCPNFFVSVSNAGESHAGVTVVGERFAN